MGSKVIDKRLNAKTKLHLVQDIWTLYYSLSCLNDILLYNFSYINGGFGMNRKLRMGMVGGGKGAFIGAVHRMAALLDGKIELVCGAFSSNPERSKESGAELLLPPDRVYGSYAEMFETEAKLPADVRMDFVSIVTPNNAHFGPAMAALEAGFNVICDKPMTFSLQQAEELAAKVKETGLLFGLTHNYTGYPMIKEAKRLFAEGELGAIRRVTVEYPQGWLALPVKPEDKQGSWRSDPTRSGVSLTMGDIGSHCFNLAEYVTGLKVEELCSDLTSFVPGRVLDDDGNVLLKFNKGAKGVLWASGIAIGEENGLCIRVYGEKGSIEWHQQEPNTLLVKWLDKPTQLIRTATPYIGACAASSSRLPAGHPEGFIEAFANIYSRYAEALAARLAGDKDAMGDFPTVEDGVRGMKFIETVVKSSKSDQKWFKID